MHGTEGWEILDDDMGVLTREYPFRKGATARMMTARLADGQLVVISPAAGMTDAAFAALERFGGVGAIVAPNGFHYLGLPEWTRAFPEATLHAPRIAVPRILGKLGTELPFADLASLAPRLGSGVNVLEQPGTSMGETWLTAETRGGPVFYVADTCFNMPVLPPFPVGLLFRLTGSAPGFKVNGLGMAAFVKDKKAYLDFVDTRLDERSPARIVTAHGPVVEGENVARTLRELVAARR